MEVSASEPIVLNRPIPWFGARKMAKQLLVELGQVHQQLKALGALTVVELDAKRADLERQVAEQTARLTKDRLEAEAVLASVQRQLAEARQQIVATEELAVLQEAGVYQYRHPLTDAVAYEKELDRLEAQKKLMVMKDGGAIEAATDWTVNGSKTEGRKMVREFSKLMLRAFNAEADNLVRGLKPYKLKSALDRLKKVDETIRKLGKTMRIQISKRYYEVRAQELELTADFLAKQAEQKEAERAERARIREEQKVQAEMARERARLQKERQHYVNALQALEDKGDADAAARVREQLGDVDKAIESVDYRVANIRAGYVYVISNIGSFGDRVVKIGLTRRLDPMERVHELGDASVPFKFDTHAIFFSKDAVGIETAMHERLASKRVNIVNRRREFFLATPAEIKTHLTELTGELLEFTDEPEALEYRQCLKCRQETPAETSPR